MASTREDMPKRFTTHNEMKNLIEDFAYIQQIAHIGYWKYDAIEDKFYGSEEMYRIYGIDPTEHKTDFKNTIELVHPDDRIKVQDAMRKHMQGEFCEIDFRILQKDGLMKYVVERAEPLFDQNGQFVGILGTLQDITDMKLMEKQMEKIYENLAKAQSLAHVGSWELDIVNNRSYCSDECYKICGISPEQYDKTLEGFLKFVHPDDEVIIEDMLKKPSEKQVELEFRIIRPDGSVRNVYELVEFVFDEDKNPIYLYGTIQDITEKKELEYAIKQKKKEVDDIQKRFQVLVQESNDVFEIISRDGTIKYISNSVEKITGYKPEERIGKKFYEFYDEEEKQKVFNMMDEISKLSRKIAKNDFAFKTKTGEEIVLELTMKNLLHEPVIEGFVVNYRDITNRVKMEKEIAYTAIHDGLTGLPNRIYFMEKLKSQFEHAKEKETSFALIMLDIGGFRYINDALGYEVGDELIKQVSQRLKALLGDNAFISRYFGVQFAIILPELNSIEEYKNMAEDIIRLFNKPFKIKSYELDVSANIGSSLYPEDGLDVDSMIKHANAALIRSKQDGKNVYKFYSSQMDIQSYKQFVLRHDLRKAIIEGQLRVYYQPLVNIKTNEILAAEALIRWEHPDWGMIPPNEFIPMAEESGLIIDMGKWILREVCSNYKKWKQAGLPDIKVSVNFSSIQFLENNFVENIINIISEFNLDPSFLIMEITESVFMREADKAISDIKRLKSYGIKLCLDDFGTGFSSLSYLNLFNIDLLKIDGSFIKNIILDETSAIIIKTIINMAYEMKIKIVAEGIESWEQLSYLRELRCHTGQGYIYSKPLPLEEFEKMLIQGKCEPVLTDDSREMLYGERRRYFRMKFYQLLETNLTIREFKGKRVNVGNTKVLIKNIGPGGLCFVSNLRLPVRDDIILQFSTTLIEEISMYGHPVWMQEKGKGIYEYGVEFTIDENERADLIRILNQVQIRIKKNTIFMEGDFVSETAEQYFKLSL